MNTKTNQIQFISIEGNIGAGKTTLFQQMQDYISEYELNNDKHIVFLREPVDMWEKTRDEETGKNILELFYENPPKYAFEFQMMVLASQTELIQKTVMENPQCRVIVSERSINAGHYVFTKMLCADGHISHIQYKIYVSMLNVAYPTQIKNHKIIYLDVNTKTCKERIQKRGREGENGITLDYLDNCKDFYDGWILGEELDDNNLMHIDENNEIGILVRFVLS